MGDRREAVDRSTSGVIYRLVLLQYDFPQAAAWKSCLTDMWSLQGSIKINRIPDDMWKVTHSYYVT